MARTWMGGQGSLRARLVQAVTGAGSGRSLGEDLGDVCCSSRALTDKNCPHPTPSTEPSPLSTRQLLIQK